MKWAIYLLDTGEAAKAVTAALNRENVAAVVKIQITPQTAKLKIYYA